jgi:hypothetical protein
VSRCRRRSDDRRRPGERQLCIADPGSERVRHRDCDGRIRDAFADLKRLAGGARGHSPDTSARTEFGVEEVAVDRSGRDIVLARHCPAGWRGRLGDLTAAGIRVVPDGGGGPAGRDQQPQARRGLRVGQGDVLNPTRARLGAERQLAEGQLARHRVGGGRGDPGQVGPPRLVRRDRVRPGVAVEADLARDRERRPDHTGSASSRRGGPRRDTERGHNRGSGQQRGGSRNHD